MFQWIKTRLGLQKLRIRVKFFQGAWHAMCWMPSSMNTNTHRFGNWNWAIIPNPETGGSFPTQEEAEKACRMQYSSLSVYMDRQEMMRSNKGWYEIVPGQPRSATEETQPVECQNCPNHQLNRSLH